ncbi:hypothetical protein GOBAR_AA28639 [Gossypium barbadense]|uniref:Uncharacterized protein n=1 Tax=Gossypium barbadense TaxID=3634 RepID=A0A2P5WLS2_GOSBA|nr:hypothetical protein GOBAR_AA28639 [Gossypium barbadense]
MDARDHLRYKEISYKEIFLLFPSGNSFSNILVSLMRLSKLQYLGLSNCNVRNLCELDIPSDVSGALSVPELLTSIEDVRLDGCASLEIVELANPLEVPNLALTTFIKAVNCYRLAENINALTLLKKHLKPFANSKKYLTLLYLEVKSQNGMRRLSSVERLSIVEILDKLMRVTGWAGC